VSPRKPESFIAGDLAYLACLLGKDGFEGDWCNWCKDYNTSWHDPNCTCNLWTIDGLKDQAKLNSTEQREFTASHPEVLKRIDIITKSLRKRKTPEATLAAAAERKRVKTELRKKYVDAAIVRRAAVGSHDNTEMEAAHSLLSFNA